MRISAELKSCGQIELKRGKVEFMRYLVTAEEMRMYDSNTIERIGIPAMVLMERAALAALDAVRRYCVSMKRPYPSS